MKVPEHSCVAFNTVTRELYWSLATTALLPFLTFYRRKNYFIYIIYNYWHIKIVLFSLFFFILTFRQLKYFWCDMLLCELENSSLSSASLVLLFFACHWLPLMCVWINKVHLLHFLFFCLKSYLFARPCLLLFTLHWLKANVCIPEQFRVVAGNKEDYCLCLKTRTAISGGVSLNDSPHIWVTCSVAASFHLASQRRTKECHQRPQSVQSIRKTGDKINSSLEWNYCRPWTAISHLVVLKHS